MRVNIKKYLQLFFITNQLWEGKKSNLLLYIGQKMGLLFYLQHTPYVLFSKNS